MMTSAASGQRPPGPMLAHEIMSLDYSRRRYPEKAKRPREKRRRGPAATQRRLSGVSPSWQAVSLGRGTVSEQGARQKFEIRNPKKNSNVQHLRP